VKVRQSAIRNLQSAISSVVAVLLLATTAWAQPPAAELTPLVGTDAVHAGDTAHLALQIKLAPGLHTNSNKPRDPLLIPLTLTIDSPAGGSVEELVFPAAEDLKMAGADDPLTVFTGTFVIGAALKLDASTAPGDLVVNGKLRYQACDEKTCYNPKTLATSWTLHVVPASAKVNPTNAAVFSKIKFGAGEKPAAPNPGDGAAASPKPKGEGGPSSSASLDDFALLSTANGYMGSADFLTFIHNAENGITEKGLFEGHGPLAILLIVFLGGLALNLTPCVLPMIPVNLAIIGAGAKGGSSRSRGFLLGGVYGAAMAVVYGVLGLVVILTAGTFGTINATWWFNAGIAALFLVLALAMFDVITIDFSSLSSNINVGESSKGSFLVAFGMGAVAALLAGACVAPVVVQVVLFSSDLYSKGTTAALALPFVLGVGMAVPWPIAGAGIAAMPKPGAWMVRVKQVFGVIILVTAAYYGYEAYDIISSRWVDAAEVNASVQEMLKKGWHPLDEGLAAAKREGKPVLIDMWATWCKNCLTMDKTTLENAQVTGALSGYVKIKFEAEDLDEPATKAMLQRFKSSGLPTYAILRPGAAK
jgi:thiol:disulfide interchange protein DsbD